MTIIRCCRYDGIYKVVKYFPITGKSGLLIWRYLLRRDDPEPAPWTEAGQKVIQEKNLKVIVRYFYFYFNRRLSFQVLEKTCYFLLHLVKLFHIFYCRCMF